MSADILGTSWDQCRSMVQYSFTSTETRRLVRTDSPGRPPRLSHSSWAMTFCSCRITHPGGWREVTEASVERGSPAPDEGECHKHLEAPGRHVSRFGLAVRLVSRGTSVRIRFGSPFSSKVVVCEIIQTLKWLSSLPTLVQKSFWWWQCSDRYIISLSPHLHTPRP